ncbi:MAG: phosphate butyryltransferase [Firmicutes bacterium HGW-Firmicutes-10]|jgi:phosphate butyryltransferase|nr:MAG: phosphate butyryltransferase [Firmicutes bacterium HGW-Firmicutes-10]
MNLFDFLLEKAASLPKMAMAVAVAQDEDVLSAVSKAVAHGFVDAVLIGDEEKIIHIAKQHDFDISTMRIVNETDPTLACAKAVQLVAQGECGLLMKGLVDTSIILKAVLNKEEGLRTDRILSHVTVAQVPAIDRFFLITDAAMNLYPDLMAKKQIIDNAVHVAHALGIEVPKVAAVCAVEKVNPKMPCTLDAKELSDMAKRGEISGCEVDGPFALDNAVSVLAAKHKGITTPNAGMADVLLVPNIEAGNMLYKSVTFFADGTAAGMIVGAKAPIVLTSRADSDMNKLVSIALSVVVAGFGG